MSFGPQLLDQGARARRRSRLLVMLDPHGFEFLPFRVHLALVLTTGVKVAAADSKYARTVVNAVLLLPAMAVSKVASQFFHILIRLLH